MSAAGAVLGLAGGLGLALVVAGLPGRRSGLAERVAPYLGGAAGAAPPRVLLPLVVRGLDRLLGGRGSVRRLLARAGRQVTVEQFRLEQLLWGAAALAAALALSLPVLAGGGRPGPAGALCLLAAATGVYARDRALHREVARREARMLAELPALAELLALAVAAGEGPAAALQRVAATGQGELAGELRLALADTRAGVPLADALAATADRTGLPALARFADGIVVALERGTPLADVLRAQAADAREAGRRALLESGARREIAMLVPVVFGILPVTVAFALYPGLFALRLASP